MILTRSPFIFNAPYPNSFVTSVQFTIVVGLGSTTTIVPLNTRTITRPSPSSTSVNTWIDASPYIRDWYDISPITTSDSSAAEVITNGEVLLTSITAEFTDSLGSTLTPLSQKYIATNGYGYYTDGQNYQPTKKILLSHQEYKADERGYFIVPIRVESGDLNPTVDGVAVTLGFSDTYQNYVKYIVIPMADYSGNIEVVFEGESINIELIEECKYPVKEIQFLNRFGVLETIHFYKASKESFSIESEKFKNNYVTGATSYDTQVHQLKKYNVKGNKSINIETGFLNQNYNETMKELMLSELVWLDGVPINVKSNSLEFKTRIVDKLITYSIDFEYAFDEINNIS